MTCPKACPHQLPRTDSPATASMRARSEMTPAALTSVESEGVGWLLAVVVLASLVPRLGGGLPERVRRAMSYAVTVEFPVHWGEMDAFGHVNNARYFTWFETARIAFCLQAGITMKGGTEVAPILAAAHCDYLEPVVYPARLVVGSRATKVGNTSITLDHAVWPVGEPERLF